MPKLKTRKSTVGRFRVTASGQVKRSHCNHSHKFTKKTPKLKRHLRQSDLVAKADAPRVKKMMCV